MAVERGYTDFDLRLMREASERRDQMVRDGVRCCFNCIWSERGPARQLRGIGENVANETAVKNWDACYVRCSWRRKNPNSYPMSEARTDRVEDDPCVNHMSGMACPTFDLNQDRPVP